VLYFQVVHNWIHCHPYPGGTPNNPSGAAPTKKGLARLLLRPSSGLLIVSCEDSEDAPFRVIDNARVAPEFSLGRGTCL